MKRTLCLAAIAALSACSDGPRAGLVILADEEPDRVASLERGLFALAAGREQDGGSLSAAERGAAMLPEDGRVGPAVPRLDVEVRRVEGEAAAQEALAELAREGLAIAGSPRLARAAANAAVVVPGKLAVIGASHEAGTAAQAWVATDEAGYLAGFAAAAASRSGRVAVIRTGAQEEDAFLTSFRAGTTAFLSRRTEVVERPCRDRTRQGAAADVALAVEQGADVIAVTASTDAGRGAVLDAVARGLPVVLPDGSLAGVAGPLLAARVTVPWARLVHELASHHDSLASVTVRLRDGWNGLELGPQLSSREDVVKRLEEVRAGLRAGTLSSVRPAPGAKVLAAAEQRVALPDVSVPATLPPPPPLRKHPTRRDFQPWDGKAR